MDEEAKRLLAQVASSASLIESRQKDESELAAGRHDEVGSLIANQIQQARRADVQHANGRLQNIATMNRIDARLEKILSAVLDPAALAGLADQRTLDAARAIKRTNTIALTGKDPAAKRKRDDDITLVSIKVNGDRKAWRLSKRHYVAVMVSLGGSFGAGIYHVLAHALHWFK